MSFKDLTIRAAALLNSKAAEDSEVEPKLKPAFIGPEQVKSDPKKS
ncbi:hypothetical protein [uncultured Ruegeria sp.]|nr:hypothetical protein [uncultured Ruegeria sp.]